MVARYMLSTKQSNCTIIYIRFSVSSVACIAQSVSMTSRNTNIASDKNLYEYSQITGSTITESVTYKATHVIMYYSV